MFRLIFIASILACALGLTIPRGMVPLTDGRIVGGKDTSIESFPHQVSMQYFYSHRCGASVINENTVVTAAHCVDGAVKSISKFTAGITSRTSAGTSFSTDRFIVHESYNSRTFDNDIALVKLVGTFTYSSKIQPISLPDAQDVIPSGSKAIVTGWGTVAEGGDTSDILQFVELQIVDQVVCALAYDGQYAITERMLCAGVPEGGKDACQGDSGGPLIIGNQLIGVVSWGIGCARAEYPGVYANVINLRQWIDSNL